MTRSSVPDLAELRRAYDATASATLVTPLLEAPSLARMTGAARVLVKAENLQWTGSFKVRGAYWRMKQLSPEEARRGVVAYSSGNFAQGVAAAGQALGIPVTAVMPIDAPAAKSEATRAYGARVIQTEHGDRPREVVGREHAVALAAEEGLAFLHPFDDRHVVAGQGGVGIEALDQLAAAGLEADILFCPAGGGGLIGGVSLAFHYLSPSTQIVAVEPERFNGMGVSLAAGSPETVPLTRPLSICDGLMARQPGAAPFAAIAGVGARAMTVADDDVRRAMRIAFERLKLVLEPSGAASLAALLAGEVDVRDRTVVLIASGGNVSPADFFGHIGDA